MTKHRPEYEIGIRAANFVDDYARRMNLPVKTVLHRMGLERKVVASWRSGDCAPSAFALQSIARLGGDVGYILTGRKERSLHRE